MATTKQSIEQSLADDLIPPPTLYGEMPNPEVLLKDVIEAPEIANKMNIFPIEWNVQTPRLMEIYEASREPGWSPNELPWDSFDVNALTQDQRYAISYWWSLLSVFDASGPAVFARAMIHAYEKKEEDAIRKCFFSVTRDEMNHEEVCGRAIRMLTPGGPLQFEPTTPLGKLARNNIEWLYFNGARYWDGFKNAIEEYEIPILFSSFLFGEVASSTLFASMQETTDIPLFKEAFRHIARDEGRHLSICLAVLKNILPNLSQDDKDMITKQIRAGFIFLSGVLYEPPAEFWKLPPTFIASQRLLEESARSAGFGVLSHEQRKKNWRTAVLRMKQTLDPYGIKFPALPEIGIDGETVDFEIGKIIPIF
jgi:rubrerythrin